jgi:dihydroxyacetone kinase
MNNLATSLEKVAAALIANISVFEHLDSVAGDGDLGITAGKIAEGIKNGISRFTGDIKADISTVGMEISKAAPSTFGTLFATAFIRAASVYEVNLSTKEQISKSLTSAFDGISARGKAKLGDRTVLDALSPAIEAFNAADTITDGFNAAAKAARAGAEATKAMAPKHGRAGWIGERAVGNIDAGASVAAVVFEALA